MLKLFAVLIGTLPTFAFAGDFSGFYVGASVSSDTNKYNLVSKDTATRVPYGWQLDSNDTDYSYGLNAGFNKIIDAKILVGLELGYNRSNNNQKNTGICSTSTESTYEIAGDMNTIILDSQSLSIGLNYHF